MTSAILLYLGILIILSSESTDASYLQEENKGWRDDSAVMRTGFSSGGREV